MIFSKLRFSKHNVGRGNFGAVLPGSQVRITIQPPRMDLGQVLHSHLLVAFRRVNFYAVSVL